MIETNSRKKNSPQACKVEPVNCFLKLSYYFVPAALSLLEIKVSQILIRSVPPIFYVIPADAFVILYSN